MTPLSTIRAKTFALGILVSAIALGVVAVGRAAEVTRFAAKDIEFFEKKIRPVLVAECYQCHSAKAAQANKLKGGLRLDTRAAVIAGGDSGAAATPGKVQDSLLLDALRYESFEMPPKGKLPDSVVADFRRWIELGMPDPRRGSLSAAKAGIDIETGRQHWSFRPLVAPVVPNNHQHTGFRHGTAAIDAFVTRRLSQQGLVQLPVADRTTLIRRLYLDLTGLPPAPEAIDRFVSDRSPDAWQRLVDRLLASPRFGERWGRHWLDVTRYAESITLRGFILPEAWRYRDYVIEAFNSDRPFDRMMTEQVAGDLMSASSRDAKWRQVIGTTFLTLGNSNLEDQDKEKLRMDVVDEQLEAIGRGFLAQTIGCARCHDHKFDPIPTRDYYALAGILRNTKTLEHANVSRWLEMPLPLEPEEAAAVNAHTAAVAQLNSRIKKLQTQLKKTGKQPSTAIAVKQLAGIVIDDDDAELVGKWMHSVSVKSFVGVGYQHDMDQDHGKKTATFRPEFAEDGTYEVRLAYTASGNRSPAVPVTILSADGSEKVIVNQQRQPPLGGHFVSLGTYRFGKGRRHAVTVSNATTGTVIIDAVQFLPVGLTSAAVAKRVAKKRGKGTQATEAEDAGRQELAKRRQRELKQLQKKLKQLNAAAPQQPKSMSVQEESAIADIKVHIRGDVHNLGDSVPRGFLQVASSGPQALPTGQSGRLQLGQWLASPDNPLPARVMANRIWHWLFGVGIVATPDNFGTTGQQPSHPELLDYLAVRLRDSGWSVKTVIREIVLSRTYRLTSAAPAADHRSPAIAAAEKADPSNRLLWRMNRRRLDAESLLDAVQATSGQLRLEMGGKTIRSAAKTDYDYNFIAQGDHVGRRAVYWPVLRNSLPRLFEVFDFPNPSLVTGARDSSSSPPQALYLMNNPLVIRHSQAAARRLLNAELASDEARITRAFRLCLGRYPSSRELQVISAFVAAQPTGTAVKPATAAFGESDVAVWAQVFQTIYGSIDFRYLK